MVHAEASLDRKVRSNCKTGQPDRPHKEKAAVSSYAVSKKSGHICGDRLGI